VAAATRTFGVVLVTVLLAPTFALVEVNVHELVISSEAGPAVATHVVVKLSALTVAPFVVKVILPVQAVPAGIGAAAVPSLVVFVVATVVEETDTVAFAGTTDKSPNPSEATATAETFFNEIVFTIFLSFSRFQAFPGLGWWLKRPPH